MTWIRGPSRLRNSRNRIVSRSEVMKDRGKKVTLNSIEKRKEKSLYEGSEDAAEET